jgi:molybdate transport system substrate-binding protein
MQSGGFRLKKYFFLIAVVVVVVVLIGATGGCRPGDADLAVAGQEPGAEPERESRGEELLVYCGAGLRIPMEEIARMFQEETGIMVQFSYGGSAQCVGQILLVEKGDVFLPGDVDELRELNEKDKIDRQKPVVLHIPALAVPADNPAEITGLEDLARAGVKVVLGDPEANPIGKIADKVLKEYGLFESVEPNIVARTATVNELFTYLALGQADAAVIWEDNLVGKEDIKMVHASELEHYIKTVPVVSLKCSANPEAANRFVDFVAGEKAMAIWEKSGFKPGNGGH